METYCVPCKDCLDCADSVVRSEVGFQKHQCLRLLEMSDHGINKSTVPPFPPNPVRDYRVELWSCGVWGWRGMSVWGSAVGVAHCTNGGGTVWRGTVCGRGVVEANCAARGTRLVGQLGRVVEVGPLGSCALARPGGGPAEVLCVGIGRPGRLIEFGPRGSRALAGPGGWLLVAWCLT